jgi:hypothetical protein
VAAQLLERRRDHILQIPSPRSLSVTIRDAEDLWYCIDNLFTDCPPELQVNLDAVGLDENLMAGLESSGLQEAQLATALPAFPIIGQISEKSYQAQQANLYVTKVSVWIGLS